MNQRTRHIGVVAALGIVAAAALVAAPAAHAATVIHTTDMSTWDTSQTRTAGHFELLEGGGLHIWTDDGTSQAKVAAYYPVDIPLAEIGEPSLDYVPEFGVGPGLQLEITVDGTVAGILVGEEPFYGDQWWAPNDSPRLQEKAPSREGGQGSSAHGSLAAWSASLGASARVSRVGFSLGSGVHGAGVITSMTFAGRQFTFGAPVPTPTPTPTPSVDPTPSPNPSSAPIPPSDDAIDDSLKNPSLLANTKVVAGQTLTVHVGPELVGTYVDLWLRSDPTYLGRFLVGAGGTVQVTVPATMSGAHRLVVSNLQGDVLTWVPVTVTAVAATGSAPAGTNTVPRAATGYGEGGVNPLVVTLLGLCAAGLGVLGLRRRHARD